MRNRFLLEGDYNEKPVFIAIVFNEEQVHIDLSVIDKKTCDKEKLNSWLEGKAEMPTTIATYVRTTHDENLLPEEIKVKNVGKVRSIEIAWANTLFHTRMLQSFDNELAIIKDKIMALDDFDQKVFDEASDFWDRVVKFKQENASIDNAKIDVYKSEIDVLFEALKELRKDQRKELSEKAKEIKADLLLKLELIENKLEEKANFKFISDRLKEVRKQLNHSGLKNKEYAQIDEKINSFFERMSEDRAEKTAAKYDKRITDLEDISEKMQKSIDWDKRQLEQEEKNKQYSNQKFQLKLIETKIALIESRIAEKTDKLKNINATLNTIKKKAGTE
ncbi:MAG: hypothetical protein KDE33_19525 [Bacteroidetes bacterium]|nr:hypothetical protein [Bacteroidota bacterium]